MSPRSTLRRVPLVLIGAALGLSACTGGGGPDDGDGAQTQDTRTVALDGGTVEVPDDPQRIVVLQALIVPHVLSLGAEPVAVGLTDPSEPAAATVPDWLDADLADDVATFDEAAPDLELLAELDPDLFIAFREPPEADLLEQIAPIADVDRIALEWEELLAGIGTVLDADDEAARLTAAFDDRVERFRDETLDELDGRTVSTFRVRGADELRIEVADSFPGRILDTAGVTRPEVQDVNSDDGFGYLEVSSERLGDADADLLFPITYDRRPQTRDDLAQLAATDLWDNLDAVTAGEVYEVDGGAWFGGHPTAAIALLDDLEAAVTGELPAYDG